MITKPHQILLSMSMAFFVMFNCRCWAMDDYDIELVEMNSKKAHPTIKASDNNIVRISHSILSLFPELKKRHEERQCVEPITLPKKNVFDCSSQNLKSFFAFISSSQKIEHITNHDEFEGIIRCAKVLGVSKDILEKLELKACSIGSQSKSSPVVDGCLNLAGQHLMTVFGLGRQKVYENLSTLILSRNGIERFDLKTLLRIMPHLRTLDLSQNNITKLRTCMLECMPSEFKLDLSENPISKIGSGVSSVIAHLRDKDIALKLYGTHLLPILLQSLAESMNKTSYSHRITRFGLLAMSGVLLVSNLILKAHAFPDSTSCSGLSTSYNQYPYYLFDWGGSAAFLLSPLCAVASEMVQLQHDFHESYLYH